MPYWLKLQNTGQERNNLSFFPSFAILCNEPLFPRPCAQCCERSSPASPRSAQTVKRHQNKLIGMIILCVSAFLGRIYLRACQTGIKAAVVISLCKGNLKEVSGRKVASLPCFLLQGSWFKSNPRASWWGVWDDSAGAQQLIWLIHIKT